MLRRLLLLLAFIGLGYVTTEARPMTVSGGSISNFTYTTSATQTAKLRFALTAQITDNDGDIWLPGTSTSGSYFDAPLTVNFSNKTATYNSFTIESTTDARVNPTAKWQCWIIVGTSVKTALPGFESFRVPESGPNPGSPQTLSLADIRTFNYTIPAPVPRETLDARTIYNLIGDIDTLTNPMTQQGDLIYGTSVIVDGAASPAALHPGANGTVLTVTGGMPVWTSPTLLVDIVGTSPISVAGTTTKTISLNDTAVTPGTYPKVTVDQKGRITAGASLTTGDLPSSIPVNKLAALTASRALATDGSGFLQVATPTLTELNRLAGVTSGVQSQLDAKAALSHTHVAADVTDFNTAADARANVQIGAASINALADVIITTPAVTQYLRYNGTNWVNSLLQSGDINTALGYTAANAAALNATNLTSGTVPDARFPATLPAASGANLTNLTAGNVVGTLAAGNIPSLDASKITTGTFSTSRIPDLSATYLGLAAGGTITADIRLDRTTTSNFSAPDAAAYFPYQITPIRSTFATKGSYNVAYTDGGGNISAKGNSFHLASYVTNAGTRPAVAVFAQGVSIAGGPTLGESVESWGVNPVAYTDNASGHSTAHGVEIDFGTRNATNSDQKAYGLIIASNSAGPAGTTKLFMQMQGVGTTSAANDGIVFWDNYIAGSDSGGTTLIGTDGSGIKMNGVYIPGTAGSLLNLSYSKAFYAINLVGGRFNYGIDFATSRFANAAIRLPGRVVADGSGIANGISVTDADNTGSYNVVSHFYEGAVPANYLYIGDYAANSGKGLDELHFHVKGAANQLVLTATQFTVAGALVNTGVFTQVNHLDGGSAAPTAAAGAGLGGSTTATLGANSSDLAGVLTVTSTSTGATTATVVTVTFSAAYGTAPFIQLTAGNAATAALWGNSNVYAGSTTSTFTITSGATGVPAGTYVWYYSVLQ